MFPKPLIVPIDFPDGKFNFIWCLIGMVENPEDEPSATFEAYVGIGDQIEDWESVSAQLRLFDETKVFYYAQDLDDFFGIVKDGGGDFKILDYEKEDGDA